MEKVACLLVLQKSFCHWVVLFVDDLTGGEVLSKCSTLRQSVEGRIRSHINLWLVARHLRLSRKRYRVIRRGDRAYDGFIDKPHPRHVDRNPIACSLLALICILTTVCVQSNTARVPRRLLLQRAISHLTSFSSIGATRHVDCFVLQWLLLIDDALIFRHDDVLDEAESVVCYLPLEHLNQND